MTNIGIWGNRLNISFIVILLFSLLACTNSESERPNILWIVAEDMNADFGTYGETLINTPNVDRLAADGIQFNNAFMTAPICSPARSALITGMYQTSIGAHNHRSSRGSVTIRLPEHVKLIPEILKEEGYYTVNSGLDFHAKTDYNFEWNEAVYDTSVNNPFPEPQQGEGWQDPWVGAREGQPFFAQIHLMGGKKREGIEQVVSTDEVTLPPYYPDHPLVRQDWAEYMNSVVYADKLVGYIMEKLEEDGLSENTIIFFFTDHGMAQVRHKQFVYDGGIHGPLIVRYPGHEQTGAERDELVSGIDISATTLQVAGVEVPGYMEGQSFFGPDYQPREYIIAARDRADWTIDRIRAVRTKKYKYIRNYYSNRPYMQSQYREIWPVVKAMEKMHKQGEMNQVQARFFSDKRPAEEFYNLQDDPHEINNLMGNPDWQPQIDSLRSILWHWIVRTGDHGQFPESEASLEAAKQFRHGQGWNPDNE